MFAVGSTEACLFWVLIVWMIVYKKRAKQTIENNKEEILNDRKLSMFNKETFSQLFRFLDDYQVEAVISKLLFDEDDKSLFMISLAFSRKNRPLLPAAWQKTD